VVRIVIRGGGGGKILETDNFRHPTPRVSPLHVFRSVGAHLPFVGAPTIWWSSRLCSSLKSSVTSVSRLRRLHALLLKLSARSSRGRP
jgi:hypothetical protein